MNGCWRLSLVETDWLEAWLTVKDSPNWLGRAWHSQGRFLSWVCHAVGFLSFALSFSLCPLPREQDPFYVGQYCIYKPWIWVHIARCCPYKDIFETPHGAGGSPTLHSLPVDCLILMPGSVLAQTPWPKLVPVVLVSGRSSPWLPHTFSFCLTFPSWLGYFINLQRWLCWFLEHCYNTPLTFPGWL